MMPYDPGLAERLKDMVKERPGYEPKKMFGGIGWLLGGHMCVGVYREWLIIRVGEEAAGAVFKMRGVKPMDITGKAMKGWAMVAPDFYENDNDLELFVGLAEAFVKTLPPKF